MSWDLAGNSGTDPLNNFLGTRDSQPLSIRVNSTEAVRIDPTGRVGVGTASPVTKLETDVGQATDGITVRAANGWITNFANLHAGNYNPLSQEGDKGIFWGGQNLDQAGSFVIAPWSSSVAGLRITQTGNVGIGTASPGAMLEVAGPIRADDVFLTSDARVKTNIEPFTGALDGIRAMRAVRYTRLAPEVSSKSPSPSVQIGLIAQEVELIFPQLVDTRHNAGYKAVNYAGLVAILIEACKELSDDNAALRRTIEAIRDGYTCRPPAVTGIRSDA
jgi:hypothetical protein